MNSEPSVISVSKSPKHTFSKVNKPFIKLIAGIGVGGDAHSGRFVKHRYLAKIDSERLNLRQVHLIQAELFDELNRSGFSVSPGELGENITTAGIDLLSLPSGTKLEIGADAIIELTALRNPCVQIENFQNGLLSTVVDKDEKGNIIRKAGVMGIVLADGEVYPRDAIRIKLPAEPHQGLEYVW